MIEVTNANKDTVGDTSEKGNEDATDANVADENDADETST